MASTAQYDVVILGAGMAGLTLARQLLLADGELRLLLLEKRRNLPPRKPKSAESTSPIGGYYLGKTLQLEENLLAEHLLKYNLRFHWKTPGLPNEEIENYSQTFLRDFSNIPTYQIDRNRLEEKLLEDLRRHSNCHIHWPVTDIKVQIVEKGPHTVQYLWKKKKAQTTARWCIDTSGEAQLLAHSLKILEPSSEDVGSTFFWVEGRINLETLKDPHPETKASIQAKKTLGHTPSLLSTNHFMGKGFWVWVIALKDKTCFGISYHRKLLRSDWVEDGERFKEWLCGEFPLFERVLENRSLLHSGGVDESHGQSRQTFGANRWAISGEASSLVEPLYLPGTDFIGIHNSLITEAITSLTSQEYESHQFLYELLTKSLFESLEPNFSVAHPSLADPETFTLKHTWDTSLYYSFYLFPFINGLFCQSAFILPFLEKLSSLSALNRDLQQFLSDYAQWKRKNGIEQREPVLHELARLSLLKVAQETQFKLGVSVSESMEILTEESAHLKELATFLVARVMAVVLGSPKWVNRKALVESIRLENLKFDPKEWKRTFSLEEPGETYPWNLNSKVFNAYASHTDAPKVKKAG